LLSRAKRDLSAGGGHGRLALGAGHPGIAVRVHVDSIVARPFERDGDVRRVDFEDFVLVQAAQLNRRRSGGQGELPRFLGQVQGGEVGPRREADELASLDLELDAAVLRRVDPVAEREGNVDRAGGPGAVARGDAADLSVVE